MCRLYTLKASCTPEKLQIVNKRLLVLYRLILPREKKEQEYNT